jgi:RNase P/RNase MRP subunit p29
MADLTSVAPMLKEVWPDAFETAFSNEIVGISRLEQTSDGISQDYSGRYVVIPMKVSRNHGIGSRTERAVLPLPGKQGFVGTRVTMRYQYGVGDITVQGLKLADREPRSFVNLLDQEMTGLRDDVMKDYARQFYGNGSGSLGEVTDDTTGTTDVNTLEVDSVQYLEPGQIVDIVLASGPTIQVTGAEIVSVDEDDKLIVFDVNVSAVTTGAIVVRTGSYNQEINGLGAFMGGAEVQNLAAATEPTWEAPIFTAASARAYDEILLIKAMDSTRRRSGKQISAMFTDFGGRRAVFTDLVASREYVNTIEFAHGFSALPFNYGAKTVPIVEDPDYPTDFDAAETSFIGLAEDQVTVYKDPDGWHFAEETGSMFLAAQDRSDAWEFRIRQISQLGISQRNCHFKIDRITNIPEDAAA